MIDTFCGWTLTGPKVRLENRQHFIRTADSVKSIDGGFDHDEQRDKSKQRLESWKFCW